MISSWVGSWSGTNTLAFYKNLQLMAAKCFVTLDPWIKRKKSLLILMSKRTKKARVFVPGKLLSDISTK
jgi:hypothetical protein